MEAPSTREIWLDGLWRNNAGLVQLLGLCPLLAISTTVAAGLGLGLATTAVLCLTGLLVSGLRGLIGAEIRIPVYVVIIAGAVSAVELSMHAFAYPMYRALGIFLPLIVTNCAILGRAEAFASRHPPLAALSDALATGLGFTAVLVALSAVRELIGRGTLLAQLELLLGPGAAGLELSLEGFYPGFLLALLPPGAFICLGLLVAGKRHFDARRAAPRPVPAIARDVAA